MVDLVEDAAVPEVLRLFRRSAAERIVDRDWGALCEPVEYSAATEAIRGRK